MSSAIHLKPKSLIAFALTLAVVALLIAYFKLSSERDSNIEKVSNKKNDYVKFDNSVNTTNEDFPTLIGADDEVPVIIVDEHHEVIPYWYKAVEEQIIRNQKNTLIHIDAHPDMAPPEILETVLAFEHKMKAHENTYLPLMQSNDAFITSSILKSLINNVIWIRPSWVENGHRTMNYESFIGVTRKNSTDEQIACICEKQISKHFKEDFECTYIDRDSSELEFKIPLSNCEKIISSKLIVLGEYYFSKIISLRKVKNLFVDIDEDYFGVESGVQAFIDSGITMDTQSLVNDFLGTMFCPTSVTQERALNKKVKELFDFIFQNHLNSGLELLILEKFYEGTKPYMCKQNGDKVLKDAAFKFVGVSKLELKALSEASYCLSHSPRLHHVESSFILCHGLISQNDPINEIHVGDAAEIIRRGEQLTNIIDYIYNHTTPRLFTIARSLRDGYTPRNQQTMIEKVLLQSLDKSFEKRAKKKKVIYDKELLFGQMGWVV